MIYNLIGFLEVRIFLLFFGNDIISCHMAFKFAYFVELEWAISLQSFNVVGFLGQVLQVDWTKHKDEIIMACHDSHLHIRHQKHHYDVIMTSFQNIGFSDCISACHVSFAWVVWIKF